MKGTVTKKNNRWHIVYYVGKDASGKWKRKWEGSWATKREAEKVLRSRIADIENSFERKVDNSTVETFLLHWLDTYCTTNLAPNTIRGYRVNVEKHIIPYIGQARLDKLLPREIQGLYSSLASAGLSSTSVRYVHNNLHKALVSAVKSELIPRNPADLVDPPRVERYEAEPLNPDETLRLLRASAGQEIQMPVLLAVTLGLRRGEALGLRWEDVDMIARTVTITRSASFSKEGFSLGTTKTKNSRRTLLMSELLYSGFESTLSKQTHTAQLVGAGFNPFNLVCCREDGSPMTPNVLQHQFKDLLDKASLPSIRFHDLRHTNATLMLRKAVPAKIVSAMLGHSSIGITLDTYSHVMTDMQTGAVGVMDSLLNGL